MSLTPPLVTRMKATVWPSGEIAGATSRMFPGGGDVSWRLTAPSTDTRNRLPDACGALLSVTARNLPSGDQLRSAPYRSQWFSQLTAVILRAAPPRAGTVNTPLSGGEN